MRPGPRAAGDLEAGRFEPLCPECGAELAPGLVEEDAPTDPRNVYATTKLAQEHLAAAWARATGGRAVALRYHNVYGPGMPRDTPYAGVASFFRSALERGEAPRVFEDGRQRRDFVHVRDVADANAIALEALRGREPGVLTAYNTGSGTPHTVGEMADRARVRPGGPAPVVTGEFRLGDVRHITADSPAAAGRAGLAAAGRLRGGHGGVRGEQAAGYGVMTVDVVLPCLDEAEALPWVLERIPAGWRAIVVDNGSTDGSADIARDLGATVVHEARRGFGAACHAGLLAADGGIVCFCDCDASLDPGLLVAFVRASRGRGGRPGAGAASAAGRAAPGHRTPGPAISRCPGCCAGAPVCACTTSARCGPRAARRCWPWT